MNKVLLSVLIGIFIGLFLTFFKGTAIMLGIIIVTGIALWHSFPKTDREFLIKLFINGISIRIILFAVLYVIMISHGGYGELTPDSILYFLRALSNLRLWLGQNQFEFQVEGQVGENGYLYILSFFYWLLGYNPPVANPLSIFSDKLINCLIATLAGIVVFYIAKDIFSKKVAKIASILVVFWPSILFWSMTNSRESSNILLVCLIVLSLVRLEKLKKPEYFILLFISLFLLKMLRPYFFLVMLAIVFISLSFIFYGNLKRRFLAIISTILLAALFFNFTVQGKAIKSNFFNWDSYILKLHLANQGVLSEGGPTYRIYDDDFLSTSRPLKVLKLIKAFLKGSAYFMFAPFPWALSSRNQILTYPQMVVWYLIFPLVFLGIFLTVRHRLKLGFSVVCYTFISTLFYALVEGNLATVMRHRDLILVFYFVFFSAAIVKIFDSPELLDDRLPDAGKAREASPL